MTPDVPVAPIDHSLTYVDGGIKNRVHVARLRHLLRLVHSVRPSGVASYADVGCSNGYVTDRVARTVSAQRVVGFDHSEAHLGEARRRHPDYEFRWIDLNAGPIPGPGFDLVTCFETLEHVGDLEAALKALLELTRPGGALVISVPVEIGPVGILKFLAKTLVYHYSLGELADGGIGWGRYLGRLLSGGRISSFRPLRAGWSTHFGFDHRDVGDLLSRHAESPRAYSRGTTRFFVVDRGSPSRGGDGQGTATRRDRTRPLGARAPGVTKAN